jgi:AcrR family transcriptional regulator
MPQRRNSIQTKENLLTAAMELISEKGYHQTNTNEIAARAGTAVGSFYAYFKDKKAILLELIKRHLDEVDRDFFAADLKQQLLFNDTREMLYLLIRHMVKLFECHSAFHAKVQTIQQAIPEIAKLYHKHEEKMFHKTRELLQHYHERLKVVDLDRAAFIIAVASDAVIDAIKSTPELDERAYLQDLVEMLHGYLFA